MSGKSEFKTSDKAKIKDKPSLSNKSGLLRSTLVFSAMTQISRVLGLVRDIVFANVFQVGGNTDAFFVAFKIPNFFRRLFAEGAFSQAFVPVFSEYKQRGTTKELQQLIARTAGSLMLVLFTITLIGTVAAPVLMYAFGYGFVRSHPETYILATDLLRITFPYLMFISLTAMAGSILNSFGKFAVPAITPVVLNICLIVAALYFAPFFAAPVTALAWGVFVAGILQLLLQLPFIYRLRLLSMPKIGFAHSGVKRIIKLMVPALFGSAVVQINLLFDTLLASFLTAGSVSWLYYSDRLVEFPLGVFGVAVATVILPALSQKHAANSKLDYTATLDWALRLVTIISLPAMCGLIVLAAPMIITMFEYGEFSALDSQMASFSLMAYALGLPAFIFIKVLAAAFYAQQNTRTPVKIGIYAMLLNMLFNLLFVLLLLQLQFAAHVGLALATATSAWLHAAMLLLGLKRRGIYELSKKYLPLWLKSASGAAVMFVVLWLILQQFEFAIWTFSHRAMALLALVATGMAAYALVLSALGIRPRHLLDK